ncbi:MAG: PUA domain-containing protein [Desulfurococcaceae archaeon]
MNISVELYRAIHRVYGSSTDRLISELQKPPCRIYVRVNTLYIQPGELIDNFREKGLDVEQDPYIEEAIYFKLKGPFNIEILDKKIFVNRQCAESMIYGANLYAPGIVGYDQFKSGDELTVIAPSGKPIAIVEAVVSSDELKYMRKGLVGVNVKSVYKAPAIRELPEYINGLIYPQSYPSIITIRALDPKPNELIVDMNSAPGGKTSHVIQYTHGRARLIAFDRNLVKAKQIYDTLNRMRLFKNTIIIPIDSRYIDIDLNLINRVDRVIVDPPCSNLGIRPKLLFNKTIKDIVNASNYQIQFLKTASKIVKKNGFVIYSTCTLTFEENEYVSLKAMREYGFESIDLDWLPYSSKVELEDLIAYRYSPLDYDMPGYYIVLFKKTRD